jgi:pyruvate,water dikinase
VSRDQVTARLGVPAAFETGGMVVGLSAIALEAARGIGVVWLARHYFPTDPEWEIVALIALVMGRYWGAQAVGTTSVLWGAIAHRPVVAGLTLLVSFLGFTIFREKQQGRLLVLVVFPLMMALSQSSGVHVVLTICLSSLIAWIYQKVPEDLNVPPTSVRLESQRLFGFFRSDRALLSLEQPLHPRQVGFDAAMLSRLMIWGYPVPPGYVLPAGDDPAMLAAITRPTAQSPVMVRGAAIRDRPSSASPTATATMVDITSQEALLASMTQVYQSYGRRGAASADTSTPTADRLVVIVQQQVQGLYSGIAWSRNLENPTDAVVIKAARGDVQALLKETLRLRQYTVVLQADDLPDDLDAPDSWQLSDALTLSVEGAGEVPQRLLQKVAFLVRHLERRCQGIPQYIEWSFDGDRLWILLSRPLLPEQGASLLTG